MHLWWSLCTSYLHACQGESYRRRLRSLLCLFRALINSLVFWFCTSALGLVPFRIRQEPCIYIGHGIRYWMSVGMVDDDRRKILNRLDNGRVESNPTYGGPSLEQVPGPGKLCAKSAYSETFSSKVAMAIKSVSSYRNLSLREQHRRSVFQRN